jgi:hypothetical protein
MASKAVISKPTGLSEIHAAADILLTGGLAGLIQATQSNIPMKKVLASEVMRKRGSRAAP